MHQYAITAYIKQATDSGQTQETIYLYLLNQGAKISEIQAGFYELSYEPSLEASSNTQPQFQNTNQDDHNPLQQKAIMAVLVIAAIFVGAGIFSFIASNWKVISDFTKVGIIIAAMLSIYAFAWLMETKTSFAKGAASLYFLANIIFGSGIFLIGQIFNIRTNWPDGFLLWALGVLAFAVFMKRKIFSLFAILLFVITNGWYPVMFTTGAGLRTIQPTSTTLILITTIILFATALKYRREQA